MVTNPTASDMVSRHQKRRSRIWCYADVAQLVEHHLAKVDVASSSLVVRSDGPYSGLHGGVAEWLGSGLQSRLRGFESLLHLTRTARFESHNQHL